MSRRGGNTRVYVGNLASSCRTSDIQDVFEKYGRIRDVDLKRPREPGAQCFAFLDFEDSRDAEDAVYGRNGYEMLGMRMRVESSEPKRGYEGRGYSGGGGGGGGGGFRGRGSVPMRTDYKVTISGLPASGSWQDVKDHCREAGEVSYADVYKDGTGVVEFQRRSDMEWAIKNLDDTKFKSHQNETSYIRIKGNSSGRSRSRSPRRKRSSSRSRSRSRSRSCSRSRSASRSRSRSPRRSASRSRSRSRGR